MNLTAFISGIGFATFAASGVFFLKFWRASRDRFFLYFSIACWLLAIERAALQLVGHLVSNKDVAVTEGGSWVYLIRLTAFLIIVCAAGQKNRK